VDLYRYYRNEGIAAEIARIAANREVCFTLPSGGYTSRPGVVQYENDILQMIKKGCKSIHGSVERWSNPMQVRTGMSPEEANELRIGWDLIIDIDATEKVGIQGAILAAKRVVQLLKQYGIEPSIKFSGRRGFHIGVPFECFPKEADFHQTKDMFPHYPRTISAFIKEQVKEKLWDDIIELAGGVSKLFDDGIVGTASPYTFVDIEENWGSRHMFRLPYSINEKAGLISVPVKNLDKFSLQDAKPENVTVKEKFLDVKGSADYLLMEALNWKSNTSPPKPVAVKKIYEEYTEKIPEEQFPPCMKNVLKGIKDGKKRSLFLMTSFLRKANWDRQEIEAAVSGWNEKNTPPLPRSYVLGQLTHAFRGTSFPPSNCSKVAGYEFGICTPDSRCEKIKNPISYPIRKSNVAKKLPLPEKKKRRTRRRRDVEEVIL